MRHAVVKQHPIGTDLVAGADARAVKPPFVAAKQHVSARNVALDCRDRPMADGAVNREGLRREDLADCALRGVPIVVMKWIGILHALGPAADIRHRDRFLQLAAAQRLADPLVRFGGVKRIHVYLVNVLCHLCYSSVVAE